MSHKLQGNADNCLTALIHIEPQEQIGVINLKRTIKLDFNSHTHCFVVIKKQLLRLMEYELKLQWFYMFGSSAKCFICSTVFTKVTTNVNLHDL